MKEVLTIAFLFAMPMTACLAQSAAKQACNAEVDVTDTDPKGTNVRAAPSGAVVTALKNPTADGFIIVHLTGGHAAGDQQVELLGCFGEFLKVHVKKGVGWTKEVCTNMNTACS